MKKAFDSLRLILLLAALVLTAAGLMPTEAQAIKSCEFYGCPGGPSVCAVISGVTCYRDLN